MSLHKMSKNLYISMKGEKMEYTKTCLPDFLSVRSIITIFRADFSSYKLTGESESHDFCELKYVERGSHRLLLDGIPFELSEGQMMIYAPNAEHIANGKSDALASIVSFESDTEAIRSLCNRVITLNMNQRKMIAEIVSIGEGLFRATLPDSEQVGMLPRDGTNAFELQALRNRFELFLLDVYQSDSRKNGARHSRAEYDTVVEYLKSNMGRDLSLNDIANGCSMSVSRLKQVSKEACGLSPISLFITLKLDAAQRMIAESSLNFTEIADALGFTSVHYFSKLFKKKTGLTPTEYARSITQKN